MFLLRFQSLLPLSVRSCRISHDCPAFSHVFRKTVKQCKKYNYLVLQLIYARQKLVAFSGKHTWKGKADDHTHLARIYC